MKKRSMITVLMMAVTLLVLPLSSHAAWSKKSVEGSIKSMTSNAINIADQSGTEVQVEISPQTQYQGVETSAELKEGDKVKVQYSEEKDKKTATMITKVAGEVNASGV